MLAIVGLNSVNAQNMSTPETNMTGGTCNHGWKYDQWKCNHEWKYDWSN